MQSDYSIEYALLDCCLRQNEFIDDLIDELRPEMFASASNHLVWSIITTEYHAGRKIDIALLSTLLMASHGQASETILSPIVGAFSTLSNYKDYAAQIKENYLSGRLQKLLSDAHNDLESRRASDVIEKLTNAVVSLDVRIDENNFATLGEIFQTVINQADLACKAGGGLAGLSTGFDNLDHYLGGLQRSDLLILAARPSMGKTALALTIAANVAQKSSGAVVFYSLEMSKEQLARRQLASSAKVYPSAIAQGALRASDFTSMLDASRLDYTSRLIIDDSPVLTIAGLRTRLRRLRRLHPSLDLVIVDYLQLMRAGNDNPDNRVQEVSAISRGLKMLAKEFDVPIIALSQLSRALEAREDKRPMLSDLRESGSIEQDADIVMFVYREEYYLSRSEPKPRDNETQEKFNDRHVAWRARLDEVDQQAEIIVSKHRHGRIGTANLVYDRNYVTFANG